MPCSGDCKAPSGPGKAESFWKGHGLSGGTAHHHCHRHGLRARKKRKLEQKCFRTSLLNPVPQPMVLGVVCPHHGNSWGIRAVPHTVGKGVETGIFMNFCLFPLSHVLLVVLVHLLTHRHILGGKEGGSLSRNWGRGRGEWSSRNSEEKLCLGKAVALIQNDPFKRAM